MYLDLLLRGQDVQGPFGGFEIILVLIHSLYTLNYQYKLIYFVDRYILLKDGVNMTPKSVSIVFGCFSRQLYFKI